MDQIGTVCDVLDDDFRFQVFKLLRFFAFKRCRVHIGNRQNVVLVRTTFLGIDFLVGSASLRLK